MARTFTALAGLVALMLLWPATGQAQDEPLIEPTEEQISLSREAYEAIQAQDWEQAIDIYQRLLDLGPLNSAYASLGYAYFKAGRCEEARDAYDASSVAPKVSNPTPEQVDTLLGRYREMLMEQCPGTVIVECNTTDAQLSVDDNPPGPCNGNALYLMPGPHTLVGVFEGQERRQTVLVDAMGLERVRLDFKLTDPVAATPERPMTTLGLAGWLSTGTGAALLVGALAVDLAVLGPNMQDYRDASASNDLERYDSLRPTVESQQATVQGLLFSGAALVAAGATMLILDMSAEAPTEPGLSGWIAPDGTAGVRLDW